MGRDGVITVKDGKTLKDELEVSVATLPTRKILFINLFLYHIKYMRIALAPVDTYSFIYTIMIFKFLCHNT